MESEHLSQPEKCRLRNRLKKKKKILSGLVFFGCISLSCLLTLAVDRSIFIGQILFFALLGGGVIGGGGLSKKVIDYYDEEIRKRCQW